MKLILVALVLVVTNAHAMNIKPGLWEISTQMTGAKGTQDPAAKMRAMMAKMPAEKRKQMEAMMGKSGVAFSENGAMKVCYTSDMLKNNDVFKNREHKAKCTTKIIEQSAQQVRTDFSCEDGAKGSGEWTMVSDSEYKSKMDFTTAKGQKSQINHSAKFVSSDCGNVKPLHELKKAF